MKKAADGYNFFFPQEVLGVLNALRKAGFEAYAVGGSVRDLLLGRKPGDWDVTTNAMPDEIVKLFPGSFYANKFFTVTVKTGAEDPTLAEVEVTTYRTEAGYSDQRHPDEVKFAKTLEEDLSRRDFTVNAMALSDRGEVIDPFGGRQDLEKKLMRAVGNPKERFSEDALRMIRAVRIATELNFSIEEKTGEAVRAHAAWINAVAHERIRDELIKMFKSNHAARGIEIMQDAGLLKYMMPEVEEGLGVGQNKHHIYTVWEHNVRALAWGDKEKYPWDVKLAALLHDVAKPRCKEGEGPDSTFYNHDVVGAKMAYEMLSRLHFPNDVINKVAKLIRWHLFKYDPDEGITDSAIRRLVREVGPENIDDLVLVRICDRMGSGVPKAVPYRLRHFQFRVEKILSEEEAPTPRMLKINGHDLMQMLSIPAGPKVGHILAALLEEVIDDPVKNTREYLLDRAQGLDRLSLDELRKLAESAANKVELVEGEREAELKGKYYVK